VAWGKPSSSAALGEVAWGKPSSSAALGEVVIKKKQKSFLYFLAIWCAL
jgi:hypothetical protein